eukprot:5047796-Pleurochrysis_carterae.AAC.1
MAMTNTFLTKACQIAASISAIAPIVLPCYGRHDECRPSVLYASLLLMRGNGYGGKAAAKAMAVRSPILRACGCECRLAEFSDADDCRKMIAERRSAVCR